MNKSEIKQNLIASTGNARAQLPGDMDFELDKGTLKIILHDRALIQNMQTDISAFEAWSLILKRWLPDIDDIIIKWEEPLLHFERGASGQHYQRFLFRVLSFSKAFQWFRLDESNKHCIKQLVTQRTGPFLLNAPSKDRSRNFNKVQALSAYSEGELEEFIVSHDKTRSTFEKVFDLKILDNQLPVGLFRDSVSNTTKVFTGGKSAIDIWGINKQNEFSLFELKNSRNNKVGALTEMCFYSSLIQEVIQGRVTIQGGNADTKRIAGCERVNCYLLAPGNHPLIDDSVFSLFSQNQLGIHYGNVRVEMHSQEMEFNIVTNEN
jgi:hypothetical protein